MDERILQQESKQSDDPEEVSLKSLKTPTVRVLLYFGP